uniref:Uncharacterized protein n=1 Tax=Cacopsylla melanoneura TaxID=428564 RepID=A0A8D8QTR3_9HEMI
MKMKKNENDVSDNEFDGEDGEEAVSEEDWEPEDSGKRKSGGRSRAPRKATKKAKVEDDDDDEDDEEDSGKKKKKTPAKGKAAKKSPAKAAPKGRGKKKPEPEPEEDEDEEDEDEEDLDDEENVEEEEEEEEDENAGAPGSTPPKEFTNGAFVVLKTDFENEGEPIIWKIDGKALLQKYVPFKDEESQKTLYKNTSVYSGWSINNKDQYYAAPVIFKQQTRKEHIVEFLKNDIKKEDGVDAAGEE